MDNKWTLSSRMGIQDSKDREASLSGAQSRVVHTGTEWILLRLKNYNLEFGVEIRIRYTPKKNFWELLFN